MPSPLLYLLESIVNRDEISWPWQTDQRFAHFLANAYTNYCTVWPSGQSSRGRRFEFQLRMCLLLSFPFLDVDENTRNVILRKIFNYCSPTPLARCLAKCFSQNRCCPIDSSLDIDSLLYSVEKLMTKKTNILFWKDELKLLFTIMFLVWVWLKMLIRYGRCPIDISLSTLIFCTAVIKIYFAKQIKRNNWNLTILRRRVS